MLANHGSERATLAGICQYGENAYIDCADIINDNTFTVQFNKLLYKCQQRLFETGMKVLDHTSIVTAANNMGVYDLMFKDRKDLDKLNAYFQFPIKEQNVVEHAKIIAKLEFARFSQQKLKEANDKLSNITGEEDIDDILRISEDRIFELSDYLSSTDNDDTILISEGGVEILDHLAQNPVENVGIPTPFPLYNEAIGGGFRRGGVNLLSARSKVGKTTFGTVTCLHCVKNLKIPVLVLDSEMSKDDLYFKSICHISNVHIKKVERGWFSKSESETKAVYAANKYLEENPYFYYRRIAGKEFKSVLSIIRRWIKTEVGVDENGRTNDCLVIYDYFKIMNKNDLDDMKEYEAMGYQISALTDFAKELDFACQAFVQTNRQGDVSQSDRLLWNAHSLAFFERKLKDEINQDGPENGNRKLRVTDVRFGPEPDDNVHINLELNGEYAKIKEVSTSIDVERDRQQEDEGFESEEF